MGLFILTEESYLDRLSNSVQDLCRTKLEMEERLEERQVRSSQICDLPVLITDSIRNYNVW
jgi:hypothetical protein